VDIATEAGVNALKLQTYSADSLTIRTAHPSARIDPIWGADNLYDLYARAAMPMEFHQPIFDRARERGLLAFSTIYDERDLEFLEDLGNPVYKIASFELVHLPLLRAVAKTGKPVIMSTGMAGMVEVFEAVETLRENGCEDLVILHCCSAYPAPAESVNLRAIKSLKDAFSVPVGFSDHTLGHAVPLAAVMNGASVIEKHFTNNPERTGPDHRFSATPQILREMVESIRTAEVALGVSRKNITEAERENKSVGRRSLYFVHDVPEGQLITADSVRVVRPGVGLHPRFYDIVVGRPARRAVSAGHPITWEDV
jgi:pseudaminic acid synthase